MAKNPFLFPLGKVLFVKGCEVVFFVHALFELRGKCRFLKKRHTNKIRNSFFQKEYRIWLIACQMEPSPRGQPK
jgi:hypothetical protein